MTDTTENDAACVYYAGCSEPRKACGYCATHCLCGSLHPRVIPPAEGRTCPRCGAAMVTHGESFPHCPTCATPDQKGSV